MIFELLINLISPYKRKIFGENILDFMNNIDDLIIFYS